MLQVQLAFVLQTTAQGIVDAFENRSERMAHRIDDELIYVCVLSLLVLFNTSSISISIFMLISSISLNSELH